MIASTTLKRSLTLAAMLSMAGVWSVAASAQTKLTYAAFTPPGYSVNASGITELAKILETKSNGALKFEMFFGGSLGPGKAALSQVKDGLVDSAFINPLYIPTDMPYGALLGDLMNANTLVTAAAENETALLGCAECVQELAKNDVKPLAYYSSAGFSLMCTKPIATLADVKGLKIRTAGPWTELIAKMGGVPVNMEGTALYEGMLHGQLDCTILGVALMVPWKLDEVTKGMLEPDLGVFHGITMFNMKIATWNKLKAEHRKLIIDEMAPLVVRIIRHEIDEEARVLKLVRDKGIRINKMAPDMQKVADDFFASDVKRVLDKAQKSNLRNADQILDTHARNLAKWQKIVADINGDLDKYQEALHREIFSKLSAGS